MACPEMLKNLNFSKNHALFNKKFEKYKVFLEKPRFFYQKLRKTALLLQRKTFSFG